MKIHTNVPRMHEVLSSVNTKFIDLVEVQFKNGSFFFYVGSNVYEINTFDVDIRYHVDEINKVLAMVNAVNSSAEGVSVYSREHLNFMSTSRKYSNTVQQLTGTSGCDYIEEIQLKQHTGLLGLLQSIFK